MYSIPFKFKKGKRNVLYTAQQTAFRNHQESKTTKFNDMLYYLFFSLNEERKNPLSLFFNHTFFGELQEGRVMSAY